MPLTATAAEYKRKLRARVKGVQTPADPYGAFGPAADLASQVARPGFRGLIAGGEPTVGLRPGQRLPDPYAQMIAGRGYAEPVSPLGAFQRREAAATVPGANPPILYSPETEATAGRIMAEERASRAAQVRAPRLSGTATGPIGLYPTYGEPLGFRGGLEDLPVFDPVRARRPSYTLGRDLETWRRMSAPEPEPPPETPDERMARIQAGMTGETLATSHVPGLSKYLLDVIRAQGGAGPMPAPFRGAPVDQEIAGLKQAMGRPEGTVKITPEQRQAKRRAEMDIRSYMREGKRTGQPVTRQRAEMLAIIQGKRKRGEQLTPDDIADLYGPKEAAQLRQEALQKAQVLVEGMTTLGSAKELGPGGTKLLVDMGRQLAEVMRGGGVAGGGMGGVVPGANRGGETPFPPPVVPPDETAGHAALDTVRSAVSQMTPTQETALEEAIQRGDVRTLQRMAQLAGVNSTIAWAAAEQAQRAHGLKWETVNERLGIGQWVPLTP